MELFLKSPEIDKSPNNSPEPEPIGNTTSSNKYSFYGERLFIAAGLLVFFIISMIVSAYLKLDKVTDPLINISQIYFGGLVGIITGEIISRKK